MNIDKVNLSQDIINILLQLGFSSTEELVDEDYFTLVDKFPGKIFPFFIYEMNQCGYLFPKSGEETIYSLSITRKLLLCLVRNNICYLSQLKKYTREKISRFRNMGKISLQELDLVCINKISYYHMPEDTPPYWKDIQR